MLYINHDYTEETFKSLGEGLENMKFLKSLKV